MNYDGQWLKINGNPWELLSIPRVTIIQKKITKL